MGDTRTPPREHGRVRDTCVRASSPSAKAGSVARGGGCAWSLPRVKCQRSVPVRAAALRPVAMIGVLGVL
eukprot:5490484-Prymnesium_polylepis.1